MIEPTKTEVEETSMEKSEELTKIDEDFYKEHAWEFDNSLPSPMEEEA